MGPSPGNPYSLLRQDASNAMLGLNQSVFDRGLQYRTNMNDRARRDARRDQKYAAYGAGAGGLGNILSMIPGAPPPVQPGAYAGGWLPQPPQQQPYGAYAGGWLPGQGRNYGR